MYGVGRRIDYWDRKESLEIDPHKYIQVIFDKGAKTIHWKRTAFSTNDAGAIGHQRQKIELQTLYINWTMKLSKIIKFLGKNISDTLQGLELANSS